MSSVPKGNDIDRGTVLAKFVHTYSSISAIICPLENHDNNFLSNVIIHTSLKMIVFRAVVSVGAVGIIAPTFFLGTLLFFLRKRIEFEPSFLKEKKI